MASGPENLFLFKTMSDNCRFLAGFRALIRICGSEVGSEEEFTWLVCLVPARHGAGGGVGQRVLEVFEVERFNVVSKRNWVYLQFLRSSGLCSRLLLVETRLP